ncbi:MULTISPECIES: histidinol-phosphate transaminase [Bacillaceae]|uniref:Histidinol-phosphate aminotransferase n=1 Tax=Evansella alkalicola TaxID=745819 RepID=A0ABS6JZW8_9BACI|nr:MULTISPECIES: histidinol-phosphate transaminase [Bacillaceae]MBU9723940.1 histidinol-phosphate transaminase [Bacillus alkalicola]
MRIKPSMEGLVAYQPGKPIEEVKEELGLKEVIKLASNENPYGCSNKVIKTIQESLFDLAIYPDGYARNLRQKVADNIGVKETQLLFGNGSDDVILILCRSLLSPGDNIVTATPTFSQYKHNAVIEGADVKEVPLVNGVHDLNAMVDAIDAKTKMVFVCNPNNPTGTYNREKEFKDFMKQVPDNVLVISDEAYHEYVEASDYPDTVPMLGNYRNLLILRTFSKAYGLASLRVGFGIGSEDLIQAVDPGREPFNTNTLGQRAAYEALGDQVFIKECFIKNREEMKRFEEFCERKGYDYYPSQTNFILIDFKKPGSEVFQYLLENGFITRNGEALGFPTSVRITLGTKEQNTKIIELLNKL